MIVIYPDHEIEERRSKQSAGFLDNPTARKVGKFARRAVLGPLWSIPVERTIERLSDKVIGPDIFYATRAEFERANFTLPGYLQLRTLYVVHPKDPSQYYPAASFHRMAFEHKFAEALRLLTALGASHLVVEHAHGWSAELEGTADVPFPEEQATVGLSAKGRANSTSKVLFEATYEGSHAPRVPSGLVWFPHELLWQEIANGRIDRGLSKFSLTLCYSEDFGVNAQLIAKAEELKIELGGKFKLHEETVWKLHGDFSQIEADRSV